MSTRAIVNALRVVEALVEEGPVGLSDLARLLDMSKATLLRVLQTLEAEGWSLQLPAPDQRWKIAPHAVRLFVGLGVDASLRDLAVDVMSALQMETTETVHLSVPESGELVLVERLDSAHALRAFFPLGTKFTLHGSASGLAYLSAMPDAFVDEALSRPLAQVTEATPTEPAVVRQRVEQARERGYSTNVRGSFSDISSVGAPIRGAGGEVVATMSVSGASTRMGPERLDFCGPLLVKAAAELTSRLRG